MSDINEAIEYLQNAEYNCNNVKKLRDPELVDIVKEQIQSAIRALGGETIDEW